MRGPNVALGYWQSRQQTEAAFADGWYKTGDLGEFDRAGNLIIKGRKKDMIALASGQKVYPEDIEATLKKHPAVADAAVIGLPRAGGPEVHAVLLLAQPEPEAAVIAWANARLADHQQIRGVTVWPEADLPRTHTLKVKKGLLMERLLAGKTAPARAPAQPAAPAESGQGVAQLIANLKGWSVEKVTPALTLGNDLDLDSLGRVELLSIIEEELGVYLDESQVGPTTTVAEMTQLVAQETTAAATRRDAEWGRSRWCCALRGVLQRGFVFPGLRLAYRMRTRGHENLQGLQGPVMFAANHCLRLDNGVIIRAMPHRWRRRLAIAAWDNLWSGKFTSITIPLLGNGFPFSKQGNIRSSLNNLGQIVDNRWSVLIYPEGKLTIGGPMQPFLSGIGLVAVEGRLPVVPLKLDIKNIGYPTTYPALKRGHTEVRFGKPLTFPPGTPYAEAARVIEEAVRAL